LANFFRKEEYCCNMIFPFFLFLFLILAKFYVRKNTVFTMLTTMCFQFSALNIYHPLTSIIFSALNIYRPLTSIICSAFEYLTSIIFSALKIYHPNGCHLTCRAIMRRAACEIGLTLGMMDGSNLGPRE
jgi:hypothetical protein